MEALVNAVDCVGYSAGELEWIARLYNVNVQGQLGAFLAEMGKVMAA